MSSQTSSLQPHHVANLILILRRANCRYSDLAATIRKSTRPSFRARMHAAKRGLRVDVEKAVRLEQSQVSVVPLPILELNASPLPTSAFLPPAPATSGVKSKKACSTSKCSTPPHQIYGPTSTMPIDAPALSCSRRRPLLNPYTDEGIEGCQLDGTVGIDARNPTLSSSSNSASSSDFSSGPSTPNNISHPLAPRFKRKSAVSDHSIFDKRPKFERKDWVFSVRPGHVMIPTTP